MAESTAANEYSEASITKMLVGFDVPDSDLEQFTPMEVNLTESLLTPGLQTSVRVHSYIHEFSKGIKNHDNFKGKNVTINLNRPILSAFGINPEMNIKQQVYRIENRAFINNNVEEFFINACDPSLLIDAATLVSKLWKCTTPSAVVQDVLTNCAGARSPQVESSCCPRDYQAENIHPFQVVAQQGNAALADGNDPSFVHYMTYENYGTHHFKSLNKLCRQAPVMTYRFSETGAISGYANPSAIMTHSFPCDFDLLSDILNGLGPNGSPINSFASFNPLFNMVEMFGNTAKGCGLGSAILSLAMSNAASAQQQNACPDYSQFYMLKRQARMGLLEQDKIALRLTVPWNTLLNAGKIIKVELYNKELQGQLLYGSGDYLIVNITHSVRRNSLSTITMDCVSKTVGQGIA